MNIFEQFAMIFSDGRKYKLIKYKLIKYKLIKYKLIKYKLIANICLFPNTRRLPNVKIAQSKCFAYYF